jgi:branched-chain amino acid transport system permease protein
MKKLPPWALVLVGALVCVGLDFGYDAVVSADRAMKFWMHIAVICAINVLGATSLNIVNGMAGQFSIGHAGFVGLGAYLGGVTAAKVGLAMGLSVAQLHDNLTFAQSLAIVPIVLLPVVLVCALVGLFVGLPSLRLRGDYLAIVTLGFSEILRLTVLGTVEDTANNPVSKAIASLGGSLGYRGPKVPNAEGALDFTGIPSVAGPFWTVGIAALAVFLALRLKRSGYGRALRAVREDEIAAAAVGVDPAKYKVTAFVLAAVGAGVAGALLAIQRDGPGIVSPALMKFDRSFEVITMVILGGSGSVSGAAIGAILYTVVFYASEEGLRIAGQSGVEIFARMDAAALRMALFAASLVLVMLVRPEGIFGERELFEKPRGGKDTPIPDEPKGEPPSEKGVSGELEA